MIEPWNLVGWMIVGAGIGIAIASLKEWLEETLARMGKLSWLLILPPIIAAMVLWAPLYVWIILAMLALALGMSWLRKGEVGHVRK